MTHLDDVRAARLGRAIVQRVWWQLLFVVVVQRHD